MSRSSDKLNIIDQSTYQNLKNNNEDSKPRIARSAKYKNKHKNQQQCSLFDFLILPRQKQKQKQISKQKRPRLIIARNNIAFQAKRKGKTRLDPKKRVTRLKRIIRIHRKLRQLGAGTVDNICVDALQQEFETTSLGLKTKCGASLEQPSADEKQLQEFTLSNVKVENNLSVQVPAPQSPSLIEVKPNTLEMTTNLKNLCLSDAESGKPTLPIHPIHSRRFRSYCDNCTTTRLKELTTQLLNDLERFQKRAYANNEIKARAHPRLIVGFREALSRLRINKVKLLLLATDCEMCPSEGGLDATIEELKSVCQLQMVPYCFSLMRRELAYALHKRAQISCVAIVDYDGANVTYKELLQELEKARDQYKHLTAA